MTEQEYIKSKLTWWDKVKSGLFVVPAGVLLNGILMALIQGYEEVGRGFIIAFVALFPVAVWSHISVSRKVARLRGEYAVECSESPDKRHAWGYVPMKEAIDTRKCFYCGKTEEWKQTL